MIWIIIALLLHRLRNPWSRFALFILIYNFQSAGIKWTIGSNGSAQTKVETVKSRIYGIRQSLFCRLFWAAFSHVVHTFALCSLCCVTRALISPRIYVLSRECAWKSVYCLHFQVRARIKEKPRYGKSFYFCCCCLNAFQMKEKYKWI